MEVFNDILRQSVLTFLWVGSMAGVLLGLGVWLRPDQVVKVNRYFSRWVGSGRIERLMDRPRWTERFFYRHHRLVGSIVLVGALAVLYTFLFSYNQRAVSALVPHAYWWLSDALFAILLLGSALSALIGGLVLFSPSLLRDIEKASNHWVSTERLLTLFNRMHNSPELVILRHNRLAGVCILGGSLYILVVLGNIVLKGLPKL